MKELFKNISAKDLEKLKLLLSIVPVDDKKEVVTLRVFMEEYKNFIIQNRSHAYYDSITSSFKHLSEFYGQQKAIQEIGLKETENFINYLQKKVKKQTSSCQGEGYRVYYRTLKTAFNKAVDWGYVKDNYFQKIKLSKRQKVNPAFIKSDQLLAISYQIENLVAREIVIVGFYTGMRLNEIVNLRWKNVDLQNRIITVGDENFTTKGRNQRYIPICEEAFEILLKRKTGNVEGTPSLLPDGQACILPPSLGLGQTLSKGEKNLDFVFCKEDGTRYTGNYVSKCFKLACKSAGVDNAIHFHSLRHSFASNLVQKGVPLYTIKELLGHSSISTTEIYSHLNMESLRDAIKTLDDKGETVRENAFKEHTLSFSLSRGESNKVKVFRIDSANQQYINE